MSSSVTILHLMHKQIKTFVVGRYPLPDYYTVALEVSRERTTRASTVTCATDDGRACADGIDVGDKSIRRELNEPCDRLVS